MPSPKPWWLTFCSPPCLKGRRMERDQAWSTCRLLLRTSPRCNFHSTVVPKHSIRLWVLHCLDDIRTSLTASVPPQWASFPTCMARRLLKPLCLRLMPAVYSTSWDHMKWRWAMGCMPTHSSPSLTLTFSTFLSWLHRWRTPYQRWARWKPKLKNIRRDSRRLQEKSMST